MHIHGPVLCIVTTAVLVVLVVSPSSASAQAPVPALAPLNPRFERYIENGAVAQDSVSGHSLGYIPSPIPPSIHTPGKEESRFLILGADPLAARYDLRDPNGDGDQSDTRLTPVRNQGSCGACWTFATFGSLESYNKYSFGLADSQNDYSEDNLKHRHGFDYGPCNGGNLGMAGAYLARYDGTISEEDDPYDQSPFSDYCTDCTPIRYVDEIIDTPVRAGSDDNAYIKEAIAAGHALVTSIYWDAAHYNAADYTYYYSGLNDSNHAVVIAGWDDNKVTAAPSDGAFIVRNSWGTSWGENGYFYVSYEDAAIAFQSLGYVVDEDDANLRFDTVYSYDPLGMTASYGYMSTTAWGANRFTPAQDGRITAIGLYTTDENTSYDIYIYDDFNGFSFSTLLGSQSGSAAHSGYHTIPLDTPVSVKENDEFSVVVRFQNTDYTYPLPLEKRFVGYSSAATAHAGESYISSNGSVWADLTQNFSTRNDNVCIKALVATSPDSVPINELLLLLLGD